MSGRKRFRTNDWVWESPKRKRPHRQSMDEDDETYAVRTGNVVNVVGNHIYFNGDVTDESVAELIRAINEKNFELRMIRSHELVGELKPAPLYLHVNSDGGAMFPAFSAVDCIKKSAVPVYTVIDGRAASAGSLLALVGKKRFMTRHSYLLIHQLRSGVIGTYANILDEYKNTTQFMSDAISIYAEHSNLSPKTIKKMMKKDLFWNLDTCVKYGLVDEAWEDHDPDHPDGGNSLDLATILGVSGSDVE